MTNLKELPPFHQDQIINLNDTFYHIREIKQELKDNQIVFRVIIDVVQAVENSSDLN